MTSHVADGASGGQPGAPRVVETVHHRSVSGEWRGRRSCRRGPGATLPRSGSCGDGAVGQQGRRRRSSSSRPGAWSSRTDAPILSAIRRAISLLFEVRVARVPAADEWHDNGPWPLAAAAPRPATPRCIRRSARSRRPPAALRPHAERPHAAQRAARRGRFRGRRHPDFHAERGRESARQRRGLLRSALHRDPNHAGGAGVASNRDTLETENP